jgi:hypothetical protein
VSIAAILLAAMPATSGLPALFAWSDDETLIEHQVRQIEEALASITTDPVAIEVVLGYDAERVIPLIARDNVEPIVDAGWQDAASSMRVGAASVPRGTTTALVTDVSRPCAAATFRRLLDAQIETRACVVRANSGAATPFVVDAETLAALRNARADAGGINAVLAMREGGTIWADAGSIIEVATPADVTAARRMLA